MKKIIVFLLLSFSIKAEIIQNSSIFVNRQWEEDSVYDGAGILVSKDGPITVKWKKIHLTELVGELWFVVNQDSSVYLFHNYKKENDPDSVLIGNFKRGQELTFMYVVRDSMNESIVGDSIFSSIKDKKLYTGQNRIGIDRYISERSTYNFGYKWAASGRVDENRVEVGFTDGIDPGFNNFIFELNNVCIEGKEKCKIPIPHTNIGDTTFSNNLNIELTIPEEGLKNFIKYIDTSRDTVSAKNLENLKIYYTLDGSTPDSNSSIYSGQPIMITETTTLKAVGILIGDTVWFPSEILTRTYTKDNQTRISGSYSYQKIKRNKTVGIAYDIFGRKINFKNINKAQLLIFTNKQGITTRKAVILR